MFGVLINLGCFNKLPKAEKLINSELLLIILTDKIEAPIATVLDEALLSSS